MTTRELKAGVFAAGWFGITAVFPASAQLPSLSDKDMLGYFAAADRKNFQFRVASDGKMVIRILDSKGKTVSSKQDIQVLFTVGETDSKGKVTSRQIIPESLESAQEATLKPKDVTIRGKVTGDIGFEAFVTEERGAIVLGGHLLNPAELKNPTRFSIEIRVPTMIVAAKKDEDGKEDKKAAKEREEQAKDDTVQLIRTDGTKARITGVKSVEGSSAEVTGPGITMASVEFGAYKERKLLVAAAPNSSMKLSNKESRPLTEGFSLFWSADLAKDPEGKARLSIEVR